MNSPWHYILLVLIGVLSWYLSTVISSFLKRKSKLSWWSSGEFIYNIKEPNMKIYNRIIRIKNESREPAENIEIMHPNAPHIFKIFPSRDYGNRILEDGTHIIDIGNLGSKESVCIGIININALPELPIIRNRWGIVKHNKDPWP